MFQTLGYEDLEVRCVLASTLPPGFSETVVAGGLLEPTSMTIAPDGRIFVADKRSGVTVVKDGLVLPTRFVTLSVEQSGERGVQSVLFDPNFAINGYVYVYYTHRTASGSFDRLSRFQADPSNPDIALPGETVILDKIQTIAPGYHNGGLMRFGADGKLYLGIGDLTAPTSVQNLSTINGKLLRLDVANFDPTKPIDFSAYNPAVPNPLVPADNPYVGTPGAWPIIYASGLRNPFSGDMFPGTNNLFINDVGAGSWEEINIAAAGANYGWPIAEGTSTNPAFTNPLFAYGHGPDGGAITGGSFYTGSMFPGQYANTYFFGDYVNGLLRNINPTTGVVTSFATDVFIPVDVDQAPDGSLYWLSHGMPATPNGAIHRITFSTSANQPPTAAAIATTPTAGLPPLTVSFSGAGSSDPNGDALTYTWAFGDGGTATGVAVSHTYAVAGNYNVTLTVNDRPDGSGYSNTSQPIAVTVGNQAPTGTITVPTAGIKYKAGDTISFGGTATDPEDGALLASAFSWTIVFHHNTHTHPFVETISGVDSGTFQIPLTGEPDPNQWYRIHLTVTDSGGLQHSSFFDVLPQTATFTLATNFGGVINLDGSPATSGTTITGVMGMVRTLTAPLTQTVGSQTYNFVSWSDGGAATHDISTPTTSTTYTATYSVVTDTTLPVGFQESLFIGGLYEPSGMTFLPDGRILVTEKPLDIRIVKNGALLPTPFLTLPIEQSGDRGIQSVIADPNFAANGYVYVYYTRATETGAINHLSRFTVLPGADVAEPTSEVVLIDDIPTIAPGYHNGGLMRFGADGMLYLGVGELTKSVEVQGLSNLTGKLLRLNVAAYVPGDPDSIIPLDNPFNNTPGARKEIWAIGLRNPFSGDMLPGTSTLFINDVGAGWEEINIAAAGVNFGWPITEGSASTDPAFTKPIYTFPSTGSAIAGGGFYSSTSFPEQYNGMYFFGDYLAGTIKTIDPTTHVVTPFATNVDSPVNIIQGPDGSLYVVSHGPSGGAFGAIYRITYTGNQAPTAVATATTPTAGQAPLTVSFSGATSTDPNGDPLTYTWNFGDGATATGVSVSHTYASVGSYNVTLTVNDRSDGSGLSNTSQPINVFVGNQSPTGTITLPTAGTTFKGGDTIAFAATASDPEDGALPASAFSWLIELHHDGHIHSTTGPITGVTSGSFQIPVEGEIDPGQSYRVVLTVTDSEGAPHTSFVEILAQTSTFTLTTNIPGLTLALDGVDQILPVTITDIVGMTRILTAPVTQSLDGHIFNFVEWSDGGAATHSISTPSTAITYTAIYVSAENLPPTAVASATSPTTGESPLTVSFSGTGSTDPDNDSLTYTWDFGDGTTGTGAIVSHTYAVGSYNVTLTVNDRPTAGGLSSTSQPIAITVVPATNLAPTAVASATSPTTGEAPFTVSFSGVNSSDPDNDPLTYTWDFGDGTTGTGPTVSRTYAAGNYNVTLTVKDRPDSSGLSSTSSPISITVAAANIPPVAVADSATTAQEQPVTIAVLSNDTDPNNDTLTVTSVTQGAHGTVVINPDKTVRYTPAANYIGSDTFQYTISDGRNGTATGTVSVAVRGVFYFSTDSTGTLSSTVPGAPSVSFDDADIVQLSIEANGQYQHQMFFDGSDVGLTVPNEGVDAFAILPDGSIVISTRGAFSVPGPSGTITGAGEDLLRFVPTSTGANTAGTWSLYFDGSDVGLTGTAENIDAIAVLADGRLLISGNGNFNVNGGVTGQDEDLIAFTPTSLGTNTAGAWAIYFDGSDVALSTSPAENVDALFVRESASPGVLPKLFISTSGNFAVTGLSGASEDVFGFTPSTVGSNTAGTYGPGLTFSGGLFGLAPYNLDGFRLGPVASAPVAQGTATSATAGIAPLTVSFSGAGSSNPGGGALTYSWDFGDGATGSGETISHLYATPGTYNATLTVSAGALSSTSVPILITVTAVNHAPAAVAVATTPTSGNAPLTVSFSGTGSTDPDNDPLTYTWDFGDGTTGTGATVSHTYAAGNYNATLTVNDRGGIGGLSNTSSPIAITVAATTNLPPSANTDNATTTQDLSVIIAVLSNDTDPNGDQLTITSVTQGTRGTVVINPDRTLRYTPTVNYLGNDTFQYTISDGKGGTATATVTVAVRGVFHFSTDTDGTVTSTLPGAPSVSFDDADIVQLSIEANGQYQHQLYFDGSDVGLTVPNEGIDAFVILPDGSIVMSTRGAFSVPGPNSTTLTGAGEDLLRFTPTSTGSNTAGTWSMYFDGSDVGLTGTAENIDALAVLADGRLLISVNGNFTVNGGVTGQDEDLIAFTPASLGATTAGTWSLYFDGSDVSLSTSPAENIDALYVRESTTGGQPKLFLSTTGNFTVPGLSGASEDIFGFTPSSVGSTTAGTYGPGVPFRGSSYGLAPYNLDGIYIGPAPTVMASMTLHTSLVAGPAVAATSDQLILAASYATTAPSTAKAGKSISYAVTLTNTGSQTWKSSGSDRVRLGIYFDGTSDAVGAWSSTPKRFGLPKSVAPGESVTFTVTIKAPSTKGDYVLRQRLVMGDDTWFTDLIKTSVSVKKS
jgi:glucose/arabinose dehydrogenase/chitodextrinase